jgi:hypothetical protein
MASRLSTFLAAVFRLWWLLLRLWWLTLIYHRTETVMTCLRLRRAFGRRLRDVGREISRPLHL